MCGRYTNTRERRELVEQFGVEIDGDEGTRRYNICPTEEVLAVVAPNGGGSGARLLRWGISPPWATRGRSRTPLINCRSETAAEKVTYRSLIAGPGGRALVLADGWFEWGKPPAPGAPRQPFYFRPPSEPFALAGLWCQSVVNGLPVDALTILTRSAAPDALACEIHDRMPVVLDEDARAAWLDPALDGEAAVALCTSPPRAPLLRQPAHPAVNRADRAREGPYLLRADELRPMPST